MKVDLTLLKKLVSELELSLANCDKLSEVVEPNKTDFVVEMNKGTGLAAGIMTEAALLMGDMQAVMHAGQPSLGKNDFFEKIMTSLKGPGNVN